MEVRTTGIEKQIVSLVLFVDTMLVQLKSNLIQNTHCIVVKLEGLVLCYDVCSLLTA